MSLIAKSLVAVCTFLMLAETASISAATQGLMEGHLKIVSIRTVEPSDEMPRPAVAPESYAEYLLIVLSKDEMKEVTRVTADRERNYRVELPPGDYILDVLGRAPKRVRARPQPFGVVSGQTVRVDMDIDTRIR